MRLVFISVFMCLSTAAFAQSKSITKEVIGCRSEETRGKLTKLAVQGDNEAYKKLAMNAILTDECILWEKGTKVFLDRTQFMGGLSCLRPAGKVECYWTANEAIQ